MYTQKKWLYSYDKTPIYYEVTGTGTPLLLLHGNNGNRSYFAKQIEEFSQYFQVFAIDSRGHGDSGNNQSKLTYEMMSKDLALLIKKENLQKIAILGFSDGAVLALVLACQYPDLPDQLVLNSPNIFPEGLSKISFLLSHVAYILVSLLGFFSRKMKTIQQNLSLDVNDSGLTWQDLTKISCPTLVVMGERDIIQRKHIQQIAAAIPNSQFCLVKEGRHQLNKSHPIEFSKLVLNFLHPKDGGERWKK